MSQPPRRVLIVDHEEGIRDTLSRLLRREGFEPLEAPDGETALDLVRRECPDALLLETRLPDLDGMEVLRRIKTLDPDLPVVMMTSHGLVRDAIDALRAGADDYLEKPFMHADVISSLQRSMADRRLRKVDPIRSERMPQKDSLEGLMGSSEAIVRIATDVARVARSDFAVLITGETGTGKELVAHAIHRASPRASGPFVALDCGAIPETLFEGELFGHEKGAFTGADRLKRGMFEAASGGSLFLDEISNMPLGCQAKLLRALQEQGVTRVGGTQPVRVDIRLVAATNRDLETAVLAGTFRHDLFFRLNEFPIGIPPLRERKQDIVFLAKRFLDLTNHELGQSVTGFSEAAVTRLLAHDWPGNVRELRSTIRRAVLLADSVIGERHLSLPKGPDTLRALPRAGGLLTNAPSLKELVHQTVVAVEHAALIRTLRKTEGNKAEAARLLQIDYKTLYTKLKAYGIPGKGGGNHGQAAREGRGA